MAISVATSGAAAVAPRRRLPLTPRRRRRRGDRLRPVSNRAAFCTAHPLHPPLRLEPRCLLHCAVRLALCAAPLAPTQSRSACRTSAAAQITSLLHCASSDLTILRSD
eukprot:5851034-Prymnesium_polylepis.1